MFLAVGIEHSLIQQSGSFEHICPVCGTYSRAELFMLYSVCYLFFIPLFKFNRRYYIKMRCCNAYANVDNKTVDEMIANGFKNFDSYGVKFEKEEKNLCRCCGRELNEDYEFCPYCGRRQF